MSAKRISPFWRPIFFEAACKRFNRPGLRLTESQINQLLSYDWPGNVRKLQNVVERAVIAARSGSLQFDVSQTTQSGTSVPAQSGAALPEDPAVMPDAEMKRARQHHRRLATQQRQNLWATWGGATTRHQAHHA